jgi:hypothetical protein
MTNLKKQTPKEIDILLAGLWENEDQAIRRAQTLSETLKKLDRLAEYRRKALTEDLAVAQLLAKQYREQAEPLEAEYRRRPWRRYFLVVGDGHVHRGRNCSTCFATTRYTWLVELAGCDEQVMVAEYGEKACTICFPDAPSMYQALKAQGLTRLSPQATERKAAKDAREAKRAALAAKREAASIRNPDGSTLKGASWRIDTLSAAQRELVDAYSTVVTMEARQNRNEWYQENLAAIERIAAAIAHKTGQPVAAVKTQAEAKARKRGY